jgi:hypothetical protein
MIAAGLTMRETATLCGVHYDTLRKNWRDWQAEAGFPAPFLASPPRWSAEALRDWMAGRSAGARVAASASAAPGRGAAARAALAELRSL